MTISGSFTNFTNTAVPINVHTRNKDKILEKCIWKTSMMYLGPSEISMVEPFCENSLRQVTFTIFAKQTKS